MSMTATDEPTAHDLAERQPWEPLGRLGPLRGGRRPGPGRTPAPAELALAAGPWLAAVQDRDLRYLDATAHGARLPLAGRTDDDLFPAAEAVALAARKRAVLDGGAGFLGEVGLTVAGVPQRYELALSAVRDAGGAVTGVRSLARAVTEHARRRDALAAEGARRLAAVAHELRTPLAAAVASVELLGLVGGDPARAARTRGALAGQLDHLAALVDGLWRAADGGREPGPDGPVAVEPVVAAALAMVAGATGAGGRLVTVPPAQPVLAEVQPALLTQVVINLVHNALKFSPADRPVTVAWRARRGELVVSVRDEGVGLAASEREAVFEPFVQLSPGRDRRGLGLGLWLVRVGVEACGGRIEARSGGPGRGAEFVTRLPLRRDEPARELAAGGPAGRPRRVLVIDDSPVAADALAALAESLGHRARGATPARAQEAARRWRPEVVLAPASASRTGAVAAGRGARRVRIAAWGDQVVAGPGPVLVKPVEAEALAQVLAAPAGHDAPGPESW